MSYGITEATGADHPACDALLDRCFATTLRRLLGRVPPGRGEGTRITNRHRRAGAHVLVVRDDDGTVRGVVHLQRAGSRSLAGPLAVDPAWQAPWREGVARALLDAAVQLAVDDGGGLIDSVTFPHSPTHFELYYKYGDPVFQAPFLSRDPGGALAPPTGDGRVTVVDFGALDASERTGALDGCRAVTDRFFTGFDHEADIRHASGSGVGSTVLAVVDGAVVGFAVWHHGPGGEGFFDEQVLVKHLYVDPGQPDPGATFHALLDEVERTARARGAVDVSAMVSSARRSTLHGLWERGYRVTQMHQQMLWAPADVPSQALRMFQPSQFALAEWR